MHDAESKSPKETGNRLAGLFSPLNRVVFILACLYGTVIIYSCSGDGEYILPASEAVRNGSPSSGKITLTWDRVSDADSYNVYISSVPGAKSNGQKVINVASPFAITDLRIGTTYYAAVTAIRASGLKMESKEAAYTAGEQEKQIHLTFEEMERVTLAWDSVKDALSYNIYLGSAPGVGKAKGSKISDVKSPYTITALKKGVTYYFVVTAVYESGESDVSEEITYIAGE